MKIKMWTKQFHSIVLRMCVVLLCFLHGGELRAQDSLTCEPVDTVNEIAVSWLTCSPGEEVYALYGHTALRVRTEQFDVVYNYGVFNFNTPHFALKFALGHTDYELGAIPYYIFEKEYRSRGSYVVEQIINLTHEEKLRLLQLLAVNYLPQNRIYRYNYFYDNCTTRARDIVEKAIDGEVCYPHGSGKSYRQIIHEHTQGHPWAQLGNDLCLGAKADVPVQVRQEMFAPLYFMGYAEQGSIVKDGKKRPLLCSTHEIIPPGVRKMEHDNVPSPAWVGGIYLVVALIICMLEWLRNRIFWEWDIFLSLLQGIGGCLVCFLFFFSTHPTVDSNWQILLLNPLPLFFLWWQYSSIKKRKKQYYHWVYGAILTLFVVFLPFIPQDFDSFVVLLALILLTRSYSRILWQRRNRI
jgi:hypothetical protein